MLLAVDIGNTNISCGIFKGPKLIRQFDISTKECFKTRLIKKLKYTPKISVSVICSVVPKQIKLISGSLASLTGRAPYIIGKDFSVPIKNLYRKPKQVGQDRLVNAYAASIFYRAPLIVIDSGTAVTFDLISRKKEYLGGLITPGMGISLKVLKEKTALLPEVKLSRPRTLIGQDTKSSILSGIVFGAADLCSGIVKRIRQQLGKDTTVIGTGGNICLIQEYSNLNMKIDKDLTLKGINLVYEYASKKRV
ncbi:MAG: type III pantothenate kinase [Candidatus Omnitrophica bacterium]|jgi:type III pantothenate kinase|nr:type III pantothenate kinase [Candidatus Omnitrophota bacterium]MDD5252762.1 type III pantothenate kinase [Candidatus Omnitrophota bacterium]